MKYTYQHFKAQYPNDDACLNAIMQRRYGIEPPCEGCGIVPAKFHRITGRRGYVCQDCGHHTYPCVATIFEHSSTPLTLWFHAMYLMTATRNGVSAKELQRQLGVTYKCAWRIGHQLRILMSARDKATNPGPMTGHAEIDEAYVGGRKKGTHLTGKWRENKTIVLGMVQRQGFMRGQVIPDASRKTITPIVEATISKNATISADTHKSHKRLDKRGYKIGLVNHDKDEWVRGIHHTNTIEGFWSHLKRGISSTHVSVSKQHAQKYVDEFAFRYNNRHAPADMFARMLAQVSKAKTT